MTDRYFRLFPALLSLSTISVISTISQNAAYASDRTFISAKGSAAKESFPKQFSGNASWYGEAFHGKKTACGEIFDMNKLTCAHLKLPFQTKVMVEDPKTGKSIVVRVTDRGPYACKRIMDLAKGAAKQLGTLSRGVAYIDCTIVDAEEDKS